eukprot:gnl/MRDRNA2_/MRDRNA2_67064_c0_seq1.p1 gnl/MRDRNA2_/MRDRNA2_67064_c0~~gnl/MRDRNA2_/MRDRNA2_67064_c0_seq1.p1  ORF type:complete len:501 (+),score=98.39 gnl/MRDRNA2_/MRDRNA2_67064_c0_seq1:2-1504(+)
MLSGLASSAKVMLSMMLVFTFVFYFFGIVAVTLVGDNAAFFEGDEDARTAHEFFNGLDNAMWTLLQVMTADSWSSGIARPIMEVAPYMWVYFVAYIAVAMMVLMNLVTAIIVENAMQTAEADKENILKTLKERRHEDLKLLEKMFQALDRDGSGVLHKEEFNKAVQDHDTIRQHLRLLGFSEEDFLDLFRDIDANEDGSVTVKEFVHGVHRMQGDAKSSDVLRANHAVDRLCRKVEDQSKMLKDLSKKMEDLSPTGKASSRINHEISNASPPSQIVQPMETSQVALQVTREKPVFDQDAHSSFDATLIKQIQQDLDQRLDKMQTAIAESLEKGLQRLRDRMDEMNNIHAHSKVSHNEQIQQDLAHLLRLSNFSSDKAGELEKGMQQVQDRIEGLDLEMKHLHSHSKESHLKTMSTIVEHQTQTAKLVSDTQPKSICSISGRALSEARIPAMPTCMPSSSKEPMPSMQEKVSALSVPIPIEFSALDKLPQEGDGKSPRRRG